MTLLVKLALAVLLACACLTHSLAAAAPTEASLVASTASRAVKHVQSYVVQLQPIGEGRLDAQLHSIGPTTGTLLSADGWILTSSYRIDRRTAGFICKFDNGSRAPARLVSVDHSRKIALLKVDSLLEGLSSLPQLATEPRVGQTAIAVGRVYDAANPNVAIGIVSATNRLHGRALQTDVAISPANYGGPLIDLTGQILGILTPLGPNSELADGVGWYDSGIGFAVPLIDVFKKLPKMKRGEDLHAGRAGITLAPGNPHAIEPQIESVRPESPAAGANLRQGDTILAVDGAAVRTVTEYRFAITPRYAGETVELDISRADKRFSVEITLSEKQSDDESGFLPSAATLLERPKHEKNTPEKGTPER